MNMLILLTLLQMISLNGAYDFTCPSHAHLNLRAKSMCKPQRNYTCLFNVTFRVNVYRERCNRPRILGPGYKYVFQPNLNRATCNVTRYQPFIFDTIGQSHCAFQKTLCNSLGQETYEEGNTTVNRKCICNTDRGYTFVMNSTNQCYCDPTTEDCSCYLGINQYNKTVGIKDIKCHVGMQMTRSRYLGDRFNISRTIPIFEFDNYKYNINYAPTNEYRTKTATWVMILLFVYFVLLVVILGIERRWIKIRSKNILTFKKLVEESKSEKRYFVRIMIVGKESAGKTCLLRRLLNESISDVPSTDGVDIVVRRCKINIEDGKWTIGQEIDDKQERMDRALSPNGKTQMDDIESTKRTKVSTKSTQSEINVLVNKSIDVNNGYPIDITADDLAENRDDAAMQVDQINYSTINHPDNTASNKTDKKNGMKINMDNNQSSLLVMPVDLMANVFTKSTAKPQRNLYALCELWDFAGQKEFYATHQAFLTSSAVYLVVAEMKDDIFSEEKKTKCSADFQHIGEYIDFWFDSIHCHRTTNELDSNRHYDPPILLVFTGKDKYNKADFKKRKEELHKQIDKVFGHQSKYHHLHDQFYLSNKEDTDKEFEKLRFAIFETAGKMKIWGEAFPLKWILLEHLIEINKKHGKHFINFTDMFKLAKHHDINILKEDELLLFLRFQHSVGNIIFFDNIRDLIILNPQWLADAFRCLVSDRIVNSRLYHLEDWTLFTRHGKISESLITELFESKAGSQFSGQKDNLQEVMEKLDILVRIENSSYFIMPSKMPSFTFDVVCEKFGIRTEKCKRTSWLCFKFDFLPPSFFNHLSAWFIKTYPSKVDNDITLYRGICLFDIEGSGCKKILVTMSTDTIALQVLSFSELEGFGSTCSDIYSEVKQLIEEIIVRYKVQMLFKLHFKCSDGYYYKDTFEFESLKSNKECFCIEHRMSHQSEQMYSLWMKKEVKRIHDSVEIGTKKDAHNSKNEPIKEEIFIQDQASVKNNLPVSVTLHKQINIKMSKNKSQFISSCIKTDNTLVFTDFQNNRLIICNADGTDIYHIPLSYRPYYITEIDSNTVAVSCSTILIINISTRSITSTINTSDYCRGISYNDNNLYVVTDVDMSIIHVMDLTGKVIRTISIPPNYIRDITVDRDRLVYINKTSIYCCSLDGKLMWKFKMDKFQDLTCVTTDNEGNVYVNDYMKDTVIVVSDDGKHHRELLTESDGLRDPRGIYFDKKENVLLVCNERDGNAFFLDVIKKLT
ncbi:uncharacterized protein [Mytilus edulis]|uniref:uncharacterized protein n=1 Tax=Mytilus edulis TaxID=6550 RepID=UPI0039F109EA